MLDLAKYLNSLTCIAPALSHRPQQSHGGCGNILDTLNVFLLPGVMTSKPGAKKQFSQGLTPKKMQR